MVVPLLVSWAAVREAMNVIERPAGVWPTIGWFLGAVVFSTIVFQFVRRALNRFSSLGVLFSLSLTFPDAAPSRMRAFLRPDDETAEERLAGVGATDESFDAAVTTKRLVTLVAKVSRREARSGRHGDRVRGYAELIGRQLGLPDAELERLRWATLLHDVGLLDVPDRILDSRNPLTAEERVVVEQHPVHAERHMAPFRAWLGEWVGAATEHHERWDGTGYPRGLAGEEISRAGRIVAVADAYDAMTASRSYKKPISPAAARRELVDHAGTQFDPTVVRAFLEAGIATDRAGVGAFGALVELPGQMLSLLPGAGAGAGAGAAVAVATGVAVASTAVAVPAIATAVSEPARAERIVDDAPTTTVIAATTTRAPTTTRRATTTTRRPTTTTTSTTTTTTTTAPPTTAPPPTAAPTTAPPPPPTTAAPTTTAPPTPTAPPSYPTTPLTTPPPSYPST